MRKTFYELLNKREFDILKEYKKLLELFKNEKCIYPNRYYGYTVSEYIDNYYFRELPFRGSAVSLFDLMEAVKIPHLSSKIDDLFLLCEFLLAVLPSEKTNQNKGLKEQTATIMGNISYILEKTSHQLQEDKDGNQIIVSKNQAAILAAEIIEDDNISFDLIEYNHYALKGNLEEKKKILTSIGLYIEPILNDRKLRESMYKNLLSDTRFVFNNFHIRHNNLTGPKAQEYTNTLNKIELEKWYDRAYDLAVAVIIAAENTSVHDEIDDLKKKYNWKS